MRENRAIFVFMLIICTSASEVFATPEIYLQDGATHDIDWSTNSYVYVYDGPENTSTTVNILSGGQIEGLKAYNNSQITMSDGYSAGDIWGTDNSNVIFSGGEVKYNLCATGNSHFTLLGGTVKGNVYALGNGHFDIQGGETSWVEAGDNGLINISRGNILKSVGTGGNSQVTISGGIVNESLWAEDYSTITIYGSDFYVDGESFGYGEIIDTSYFVDYSTYGSLTGILSSGEAINVNFRVQYDAKIVLVPEPSTLLILCSGILFLKRKSKSLLQLTKV